MDATAVLAKPFIPSRLREVNAEKPNLFIQAEEIPTLEEDIRILQGTLPPIPKCTCTVGKHQVEYPYEYVDSNLASSQYMDSELQQLTTDLAYLYQAGKTKPGGEIFDVKDYISTFRALVQMEHHEVTKLYERYSQYEVSVWQVPPYHAQIEVPGIADAMPSINPGDTIFLRPLRTISLWDSQSGWSDCVHNARIEARVLSVTRKKKDVIAFTWMNTSDRYWMALSYPENTYNVMIFPSTSSRDRCLSALSWLSSLPIEVSNQLLFPNEAPSVGEIDESKLNLEDLSQVLNDKQLMFVRLLKTRTLKPSRDVIRSPIILSGPAGTGKTLTLLQSIFEVLKLSKESRVLICTPSHTAADVVTQRLAERLNRNELWRLFDSNRPVKTVPVSVLPFTRQSTETGTFRLPSTMDELFKFRVIVCTCSDAMILYRLQFTNRHLRLRRQCFLAYATETCRKLNLSVGPVDEQASYPHFTHLFIDEASQATEPEVLIPFSVVVDHADDSVKAEIALVGDPRQLSPYIYSASETGLGRSYMERLLKRPMNYLNGGWPHMLCNEDDHLPFDMLHKRSCVFLTTNYRGHPSFLMVPSSLFYFDKLKVETKHVETDWISKVRCVEALSTPATGLAILWNQYSPSSVSAPGWTSLDPTILHLHRQLNWPVHFRGVIGQDAAVGVETFAGSTSWCNQQEAEVVANIVSTLTSQGVKSSSIGVMSPFRGQVILIRRLLRQINLAGVDVGTVEDYQAVERNVIILSVTRSSSKFLEYDQKGRVGVFQQAKRANVALTRAEHLLIVVGNPNLMIEDEVWRQWLWFCLRNGFWYGEQIDQKIIIDLQSKEIILRSCREGEMHPLLEASSDLNTSTVLISSLELACRVV